MLCMSLQNQTEVSCLAAQKTQSESWKKLNVIAMFHSYDSYFTHKWLVFVKESCLEANTFFNYYFILKDNVLYVPAFDGAPQWIPAGAGACYKIPLRLRLWAHGFSKAHNAQGKDVIRKGRDTGRVTEGEINQHKYSIGKVLH